jgi:hypothetical protein
VIEGQGIEDLGKTLLVFDIDGDQKAEIMAGAPRHTPGQKQAAGRILIVRAGRQGLQDRTASWIGSQSGAHFGAALAAGDLDGDKRPDLAAGAPASDKARGSVFLFRGGKGGGEILGGGDLGMASATLCLKGASDLGGFGGAVAIGDLDGDGKNELIVSETGASIEGARHAGRVLVFKGRSTWKGPAGVCGEGEFKPAFVLAGRHEEGIGHRVFAADVTGDGITDLVATSPVTMHAGHAGAGCAVVIAGRRDLLQGQTLSLEKDEPDLIVLGKGQGHLGTTVAVTDLEADGIPELLLGESRRSFGKDEAAGAVHAISWNPERKRVDLGASETKGCAALRGPMAHEEFGAVVWAGSVDGDGRPDLLVGSPAIGRVVLFTDAAGFNPPPSPSRAFMPHGSAAGYGASLGAGDMNGDGKPEIVIGAPGANKLFIY